MFGDDDEVFPETSFENGEDAASIMADRDQTRGSRLDGDAPQTRLANNLEDEDEDFIEGDVDVKTQMDRTERQMRAHFDGGDGDRGRHEDDRVPNP